MDKRESEEGNENEGNHQLIQNIVLKFVIIAFKTNGS